MAKPNRTVAEFRRKNPRPWTGPPTDPELQAILDAVSRLELTAQEGVEKLKELLDRRAALNPKE